MRPFARRHVAILLALLIALAALGGPARAAAAPGKGSARDLFRSQQAGAEGLGKKLQGFFGFMPVVASTPYLSLAALSGVALLSETEYARTSTNPFVRQACDAAPVQTARRYASWPLFGLMAFLSLASFVGSSGKLRATVGKFLGMAEGTVAGLVYVALSIGAFAAPALATERPNVALMGFDLPQAVLLGLAIALGLGVMLVVRFAFDVLIWLSPFPLVDFLFEVAKNVASLLILALYFLSPALAATVTALLLLVSLLLYGWAVRVLELAFGLVLRPLLARFFPSLRDGLVEADVVSRLGLPEGPEGTRIATPATALSLRGVPKRRSGFLVQTGEGLFFVPRTWVRKPRRIPLGQGPQGPVLSRGLFWLELQTAAPDGRTQRIGLPNTLEADRVRALVGAADGGFLGGARLLQRLADRVSGAQQLRSA